MSAPPPHRWAPVLACAVASLIVLAYLGWIQSIHGRMIGLIIVAALIGAALVADAIHGALQSEKDPDTHRFRRERKRREPP